MIHHAEALLQEAASAKKTSNTEQTTQGITPAHTEADIRVTTKAEYGWEDQQTPCILSFEANVTKQDARIRFLYTPSFDSTEDKLYTSMTLAHEQDHYQRLTGSMPYVAFRNTKSFDKLFILFEGAAVHASICRLGDAHFVSTMDMAHLNAEKGLIFPKERFVMKKQGNPPLKKNFPLGYWDACKIYREHTGNGRDESAFMRIYDEHVKEVHEQFKEELKKEIKKLGKPIIRGTIEAEFTWTNRLEISDIRHRLIFNQEVFEKLREYQFYQVLGMQEDLLRAVQLGANPTEAMKQCSPKINAAMQYIAENSIKYPVEAHMAAEEVVKFQKSAAYPNEVNRINQQMQQAIQANVERQMKQRRMR